MKIIKRIFLTILILTIDGVMFCGWFYRHLLTYRLVGLRTSYSITNQKLTGFIEASIDKETDLDIEKVNDYLYIDFITYLQYTSNN